MVRTHPRSKASRDDDLSIRHEWRNRQRSRPGVSRIGRLGKSEEARNAETRHGCGGGEPSGGYEIRCGEPPRPSDQRGTVSAMTSLPGLAPPAEAAETHRTLRLASGCNKPESPPSHRTVTESQVRTLAIGGENRRGRAKRRGRNAIRACSSGPKRWRHRGKANAGDEVDEREQGFTPRRIPREAVGNPDRG